MPQRNPQVHPLHQERIQGGRDRIGSCAVCSLSLSSVPRPPFPPPAPQTSSRKGAEARTLGQADCRGCCPGEGKKEAEGRGRKGGREGEVGEIRHLAMVLVELLNIILMKRCHNLQRVGK